MSPLKRFIQKIAGVELRAPELIRLRAYGKLPSGMEYVHLDAAEGIAKVFPEWIKSGHDRWVERTARELRGKTRPSRAILALPGLKDQVACAAVWPSRDSASPPRAFPFALFAMVDDLILDEPVKMLAVGAQLWSHMDNAFWPVFDGDVALASLRERTLSGDVGRHVPQAENLTVEAAAIPWETWARSIATASGCREGAELEPRLRRAAAHWRQDPANLAIRLPLSGDWNHLPQAAAWLTWLRRILEDSTWKPAGLILPHPEAVGLQRLVVLGRRPISTDYQLLTTDAGTYECVEDLATLALDGNLPSKPELDRRCTLWEWATGAPA